MQQPGWGKVTVAVQEKRGNVNALHTKAFSAWISSYGVAHVTDCTKELGTGIILIQLVEKLVGNKCPYPYKVPAPGNRTQCIDTVSVALKFVGNYVSNLAVSPADIVDGNVQVVLGLLWRLILKWQNVLHETRGEVGEQAESVAKSTKDAKAKLLDWIRNKVGNYQHVRITNDFAESFDNGMALCALVHAFDPKLVAYEMLDPNRKLDNLALGMHLAEQYLGVARMLDPADVAEADDKAMMVYLYEFPKAFLARVQVTDGENGEEARNRIAEEAKRRQMEDDEARRRAEEEARRRAEEEARRRMEEDARRRMEEDARRRMEEDARRQDEARWRAEEEARRRAEEEARRRADEEEMRRRAAEQERLRLFQQYQTPIVVAAPPQIHTVVIKESSNIGRLSVDVIQCRNLKPQDPLTNFANPYVVVQVERQKERTRKEKHTLNPVFNERFKFYVSESYAAVDVCVFDSTMLVGDYFLGKVEVLVRNLVLDVPMESWFTLQPLHHGGKAVGGEIFLKLLLTKQ